MQEPTQAPELEPLNALVGEWTRADHPDFPDAIAVIGVTGALSMHYFTGTVGDHGDTISGLWELSRDGSTWDDDLEIAFRRIV